LLADIVLLQEDFESGLGEFTAESLRRETNDTPFLFAADGTNLTDGTENDAFNRTDVGAPYYPAGSTPFMGDGQYAGWSSDLGYTDNTFHQYIYKRWENALPAGEYVVTLQLDVYIFTDHSDPYAVGARPCVLTNELYEDEQFDRDSLDGGHVTPPNPDHWVAASWWPEGRDWDDPNNGGDTNGVWQRGLVIEDTINTTNGHIELRLDMHDKWGGPPQTLAYDNIALSIAPASDPTTPVFTFAEDFESATALDNWGTQVWRPVYDEPIFFDASGTGTRTGTSLGMNDRSLVSSPASRSVGYYSDQSDQTALLAAWLEYQVDGLTPGAEYTLRLSGDWYLQGEDSDLESYAFILTNLLYDRPDWEGFTENPYQSAAMMRNKDTEIMVDEYPTPTNGKWMPFVLEETLTTDDGEFEVRLLHAVRNVEDLVIVAWDNIEFTIVTGCPQPRYDLDEDGDVDHQDFGIYQQCFTGNYNPADFSGICKCANSDGDDDIDSTDTAAFESCATGPNVPADPACDSGLPLP
jgi:hypothetical protein